MARNIQTVASTLNRLTDRAFLDAMSDSDQRAMSEFITDYFCEDPDMESSDSEQEEEPCK